MSYIHPNINSDWFNVIIGVIIPALILLILSAIIYAWLKRKRRKNEQTKAEDGLRATSTSQKYERNLFIPDEELWTTDDLVVGTLEEISLNALVNATHLREANKIREYYRAISKIIRRYVGTKFDIKVADSTTGEILENLPQNLTESTIDHVGEILRICDIVEFAQYRPSIADLNHIYRLAIDFIENQIKMSDYENSDSDELEGIRELLRELRES